MRSLNVQSTEAGFPEPTNSKQFAPLASDYVNALALAANTSERLAIPAGAAFVGFSTSVVTPVDFTMKFGDGTVTAAIPAADIADGTASPLNPAARRIPTGATHVAVCAAAAAVITLEFWG